MIGIRHSIHLLLALATLTWVADGLAQTSGQSSRGDTFGILEEYRSVRNPFRIPEEIYAAKAKGGPLEEYDIDQFKLVAVILGKSRTRAMVILPSKETFYVKVGDVVGKAGGIIRAIFPERVLVVEKTATPLGEVKEVLREVTLDGSDKLPEEELKKLFSRL